MKLIPILALALFICTPAMAQEQAQIAHCVLTHLTYAGACNEYVEFAPGDTALNACTAILDYLNNPRTSGKTYCLNTQIRRNWVLVSAEGITVQQ